MNTGGEIGRKEDSKRRREDRKKKLIENEENIEKWKHELERGQRGEKNQRGD